MTLQLELGSITDPFIRRAFENIAQQFPLTEVNVPNLTAAFTSYKRIQRGNAQITTPAAGTYLMQVTSSRDTSVAGANVVVNTANAAITSHVQYLDAALYAANTRTTKLNVRLSCVPNATAPAITFTAGLYPIATYGGGAGAGPFVASLGTVVSGSTAAVASPGANALSTVTSGDFTFPSAGAYVFAVVTSGTPTVNSVTELVVNLEMRQV